ncbi:hypothetical protein AVEN_42746-1 [Araneus ventricosus]|uniref:Tc1-like transposase DDE domain-containing protein n=1 Tax=Araneus ventricosus TaxID=182803 RepID=A0A4Y2AEX0_ARAVE|nr:hypothetical protein AVEN_42746-1 [Araneus ventricosus]
MQNVCSRWIPKLSDDHKARRMGSALTFFTCYSTEGEGFLKLIVTGDETWIQYVTKGTIQSGGTSVMVWDVCSWRDIGPLIRLETTLTGDRYLSILPDHLHSFMSIVHSDGLEQFQQENAIPHTSRVATKWLQEHSSYFRHFHWTSKSPEKDIIEDIRDALLHAVEKRSPPPRTPIDLLTALQDSWCEFPPG